MRLTVPELRVVNLKRPVESVLVDSEVSEILTRACAIDFPLLERTTPRIVYSPAGALKLVLHVKNIAIPMIITNEKRVKLCVNGRVSLLIVLIKTSLSCRMRPFS